MTGQVAPSVGASLALFKKWIKRCPRLGRKELAEFVVREARKQGLLGKLQGEKSDDTEK
jgi:hypothetical protein